jgi:hypothetical protein
MTSQLAERHDVSALLGGRGRGPGGQPAGLPLPVGLCPVPGCGDQVDQTRLMCRRDWYQVPKPACQIGDASLSVSACYSKPGQGSDPPAGSEPAWPDHLVSLASVMLVASFNPLIGHSWFPS